MANPQEFYAQFQASRAAIADRFDAFDQTKPSTEQIAQIAQDIQAERKKLNEATSFLPSYDRRSYDSQLKQLESRLDTLRNKGAPPKGGFAFKKKASITSPAIKAVPASEPEPEAQNESLVEGPVSAPASTSSPNLQIASSSYQCFTSSSLLHRTSPLSSDLTIAYLDHCIVDLLPTTLARFSESDDNKEGEETLNLTAVHIKEIKDSVLLLGHIQGSILAYNLERCIVVAACHQLRIHASHNTRFYLHVSSSAIIEDSTSLTFTSYPEALPLPSNIRQQRSTHTSIQDFSHLKPTPSPNWSATTEQIEKRTWDEIRFFTRSVASQVEAEVEGKDEDRRARLEELLLKVLPSTS